MARLVPIPQAGRLGDLPRLMASVLGLGEEEAEALSRDLQDASDELPPPVEGDPGES